MATRQTRVFVPGGSGYSPLNWAETVLGRIVKPLVEDYADSLNWFWFSRYLVPPEADAGDCDISKIPPEFMVGGQYRSIRLRYDAPDKSIPEFESVGSERIAAAGCCISHWLEYDVRGDLGGNRFVGEDRSEARRHNRACLVVSYLQSVSQLVLDALIGPDDAGGYRLEHNDDPLNDDSSFQSLHHMFCNISDVPLYVTVTVEPKGFQSVRRLLFKPRF